VLGPDIHSTGSKVQSGPMLSALYPNTCRVKSDHTKQHATKLTTIISQVTDFTCLFDLSVDIGGDANLELVDKFCYLGDMLSVHRDADAAVETRIRIGWNKSRQLVPLLTNKDISFTVRGGLYSSCVHGSETWPVRKENEVALQRAEMRLVRCYVV